MTNCRSQFVILASCLLFPPFSFSADSPSAGTAREILDDVESDRIPITRRGVLDISNRLILPPAVRKQGVTGRIGVNIEYGDNIFFRINESDIESDTLFSVVPGIHYHHNDQLNQTDVDLAFEAIEYGDNSELSKTISNVSLLAVGSYQVSRKTNLQFIEQYSLTSDLGTQVIPGLITEGDQITANYIEAGATHQYSNTNQVAVSISSDLANYDDDSLVDNTTLGFNLGWTTKKSLSTYGVEYRARRFDFKPTDILTPNDEGDVFDSEGMEVVSDGSSELTHSVWVTQERLLTPLWLWTGKLGGLFGDDEVTDADVIGEAKLKYTEYEESFTLSFSRDYIIGGGFEAIYLSQVLGAEYSKQFGSNTSFSLSSSVNKLVPANFDQGDLTVLKGEASVNYFIDKQTLLRVNVETLQQESPELSNSTKSNTLTFSIVYSM